MCTIHDQQTVVVCDVIRDRMREVLIPTFGSAITFTHLEGEGTRIDAPLEQAAPFADLVRRLIAIGPEAPLPGDLIALSTPSGPRALAADEMGG